ncbi:MAG: ATP-dependent Clp protease proteolytic subunit [Christensenellales bacterium]
MLIPYVVDSVANGERSYDIYSRLLEDRIIFIGGEINTEVANSVVAQLLYLESKDNSKDIFLYINSPGGVVDAGLAIYDTMNYISCDVSTICVGLCASMGAVLLAGGKKGKRFALKNSKIMIHQPLGGVQGQASDIKIVADQILKTKQTINEILANATGKSIKKIEEDTNRDYYLTSDEALDYGLIDKVLIKNKE